MNDVEEKQYKEEEIFDFVEGLTEFDLRKPKRVCLPEYTVGEYGELIPATVTIHVKEGESFGGDEIKCSICLGNTQQSVSLSHMF